MPKKLTKEQFVENAQKIHGDTCDYTNVKYINSITKIEIRCKIHNTTFLQIPSDHLRGCVGCVECSNKKRSSTKLKKYGTVNYNNRDKAKQTNLDKYNVENVTQVKEIREKVKNMILERYGVEHALQSPLLKQKAKRTNKRRHGSTNYNNREQSRNTVFERYNVANIKQKHISKSSLEKLGDMDWLMSQHYEKEKPLIQIARELGVNGTTVCNYFRKYDIIIKHFQSSMGEKEVLKYISSILPLFEILSNDRIIIKPYELDIYIPELKFAIEYNGEYWHKNTQEKDEIKETKCKELGIRLMTIWENQWKNNRQLIENVLQDELLM